MKILELYWLNGCVMAELAWWCVVLELILEFWVNVERKLKKQISDAVHFLEIMCYFVVDQWEKLTIKEALMCDRWKMKLKKNNHMKWRALNENCLKVWQLNVMLT